MMYLSWSHGHMLGSKLDPQFTANQCSVYFLEKIKGYLDLS
jgi:hypothetical protein